ncbi:hypothetical protein RHE_PB00049 (plasmid) [Rhizobium etli CFN 42]|uniref:Uncharacterized protein n=1 Tax=Rhizobium etli (strain ATCC 51251 / DSM 11541 / JCM 21823 / NBRC 15573 / CFN 42) TaxID=347834 RepID=Q2K1X5_RHIEC|nr:hypothetical protein RHE_PB00049 [Rhizobium etli CFN 42]
MRKLGLFIELLLEFVEPIAQQRCFHTPCFRIRHLNHPAAVIGNSGTTFSNRLLSGPVVRAGRYFCVSVHDILHSIGDGFLRLRALWPNDAALAKFRNDLGLSWHVLSEVIVRMEGGGT